MKRTVPQLTVEELRSAMLAAAASEAMTRREPRADRVPIEFEEEKGVSYVLSENPLIHFIRAISESFARAPEKQQAAIERLVLVGRDALQDERAAIYLRTQSPGMLEIHQSLLEAIATVPLVYGEPSPLERIFALAKQIHQRLDPEAASEGLT
jgi:hypothetical protein